MHIFQHGQVSVMGGTEPKLNLLSRAQILRIVKLCTVIILAGCLQVYATGYGQKITLSEKDVPLTKVFKEIKKQTGFSFLYVSEELKEAKNVTVLMKDANLDEVLAHCFKDQPFSYEIKDKTIVIKPKRNLTAAIENERSTNAPPIEVRGVITDENGAPAQGVNVVVRGTNKGTTTNLKGEFVLSDIDENAVLIVTSVGYDRQEILVKNKTFITSQLRVAVGNLDEVQMIAYGTTTKRFNTGNVSTVKARDIEKQPVNNPLLALQGRVPGIFILQNTGVNNSAVTVRIQGQNSITSNRNDPLIVIDGVPFLATLPYDYGIYGGSIQSGASPLSFINPLDIESIDVLKDADATAIYGSRAANGAILITTKKGKAGKTKIEVNLQQGWGKVTRKVDMLDTRRYLDMRYEAYKNDGINIATLTPGSSNYDLTLWDTTRYTNWQKELIGGTAHYTNINASVSGGNATMQYLIGGTINRTTTVFPGEFDDKRGSVHFNIGGASLNQRFHIQLSGSYMFDDNRLPGIDLTDRAIKLEPVAPALYNSQGALNWANNSAGIATWTNPLAFTEFQDFTNTTKNLLTNALLSYKILPGLDIKSNFGYFNLNTDNYLPVPLESFRPFLRPFSQRQATFTYRTESSWIIEPQLSYSKKIKRINIEALMGSTSQKKSSEMLQVVGTGYSSDLLLKTTSAAASLTSSMVAGYFKYFALFGRVNLNWDNKYILNLVARRDGSSRFGDNNKFHNFGSIAAGWIFSQENVIKNYLPFLSFGKLKASYGTTGNDQIPDYQYLSLYSILASPIPYQGGNGLFVNRIPNPYLEWEETKKWQTGIELGFINDKVTINATYSKNRCSNQLLNFVLPTITGFTSISENFPATVENTTWEFLLNSDNWKSKQFAWSTSINFTIPKNKLISFPDIEQTSYASGLTGVIVGQPLGIQKVFHYIGIDPATGLALVADVDGNATSTPNYSTDQNTLVNTLPAYYGGINNTLTYKGFELDFLFQFVRQIGRSDLNNGTAGWTAGTFRTPSSNQPVSILDRWQKPGDIVQAPKFNSSFNVSNWQSASDVDASYSYDASYVRLKNLSIAWQVPTMWVQKMHFQNSRIYIQGQNLLTITKYSGLDPETLSSAILPPLQVWTVGIKLGL